MRKLLFIPIVLMLMVGVAAAENLEITEMKIVINALTDIDAYIKQFKSPLNTTEQQQALVDHVGDEIIYKKHNIEAYGVMLLADETTRKPVKMIIILDMIFDEYSFLYDLKTGERTIL